MRESFLETLIGALVLVVAGFFLWFALGRGGDAASAPAASVELGARFNSVSGVERGTDVRMAGVKVGTVRAIELDPRRAEALVTLAVSQDLMPLDDGTTARIQSEGLLGGNYINLEPASGFGEITPCADGETLFGESGCGEILYTQGSVDLLTLMASFASGNSGDGGNSDPASASGSAASASGSPSADADEASETDADAEDMGSDAAEADTESSDSSTSFGDPYPDSPGDNQ